MGKIIILDENTANKIAAGEVIDRPSSLVKELVENSIDAQADKITVEIKNGGIKIIKVLDNGVGIEKDDMEISFERHSTSKIRIAEDLESIETMGFRGEALASIAAVSFVELKSRIENIPNGYFVNIRGGMVEGSGTAGTPVGTSIAVSELFFNTPARFKFLKKDTTEEGYISDILSRIALSHPEISIKFISNNRIVIHTPGNSDLKSTIFSLYGKEIASKLCEINYKDENVEIAGFAGKPDISRANRNFQSFFINKRYFRSKIVSSAIDKAYETLLMKNKHAFIVLNIKTNPMFVDVNVHPSKMEVKFSDEQAVFRGVYHAVESALKENTLIREIESIPKETYKFSEVRNDVSLNDQQKIEHAKEEILKEDEKIISEEIKFENIKVKEDNQDDISEFATDTKKLLNASRIIGQVFSTYVLLECDQNLILIDQHAAHERIMYESIKKKYSSGEILAQQLMEPLVIELTAKEIAFTENRVEEILKFGFEFEKFGNKAIILRAVPYNGISANAKDVFLSVLDKLQNTDNMDTEKKADDILYTIACKAAIKANKHLDELEIKNILSGLSEIDNPYTCPHGRPSIVSISKYEAEKMFKRII